MPWPSWRCYCCASPHAARHYPEPWDEDENVPLKEKRRFGRYRPGSVLVPDDIDGLPSTQIRPTLATDPDPILYEAEIDQGRGMRGIRACLCAINLIILPVTIITSICRALRSNYGVTCDEACCWLRKEYSSRSWFRVYSNRIETNAPQCRLFGLLGCGSWSHDAIRYHPFDRGAFGFRRVPAGTAGYFCGIWPVYGWSVARQRCQCNGPPWQGGFWCDEWLCTICFCSFRYAGMVDADECAAAASIALQAYFEGRNISREDMDKCLDYWRKHISERGDPVNRKRDVCCEPLECPSPSCESLYRWMHMTRNIPYEEDDERNTEEIRAVYDKYNYQCDKQIRDYNTFTGPYKFSTWCQTFGCRRLCGRRGFCFCTEGCSSRNELCWYCLQKKGGPRPPPPPFVHRDLDDDNDASILLQKALGEPPSDVLYTRWMYNDEKKEHVIVSYPQTSESVDVGDLEMGAASSVTTATKGDIQVSTSPGIASKLL